MCALYHTHRPQTFDTVIGQEVIVQTLANEIRQDRVAHAYLFSGPRGVGKTTTARILAKAVNCEKRQAGEIEPCNDCSSCLSITRGNSVDVIEIDAASHTSVDDVRDNIIDTAHFKPTRSRFKIFIIDEVHMLSTSAFNALLKTLEEPPNHLMFILATTEMHKLPETIVSRCQRFVFRRAAEDTLATHLTKLAEAEGKEVEPEVIQRIVEKSDGGIRDAVSLFEQIIMSTEGKITLDSLAFLLPTANRENVANFCTAVLQKNPTDALANLHTTAAAGEDPVRFTDLALTHFRDLLVAENQEDKDRLVFLLDRLLTRRGQIQASPLPFLPLEIFVIETTGNNEPTLIPPKKTPEVTPPAHKLEPKPTPPSIPTKVTPPPPSSNQAPVSTAEPTPSSTSAELPTRDNLTRAEVEKAWHKAIKILEVDSPSLVFVLKMAKLADVQGHTITMEMQYKFHLDNLMKVEARHKLETLLAQEIGSKVEIVGVLAEPVPEASALELNNLAAAFGGEVI